MTKKILLVPLLVTPLLLGGCGESKPGPFQQGDNLLTAEMIREFVDQYQEPDEKLAKTAELKKEVLDASDNVVWEYIDYGGQSQAAGFIVYAHEVLNTETSITTTTYEAYSGFDLNLVATWAEDDDPASLVDPNVVFGLVNTNLNPYYAVSLPYVEVGKTIYKEGGVDPDHYEAVVYDGYGNKLVEYRIDEEDKGLDSMFIQKELFAYEYGSNFRGEMYPVLRISKWNKDHFEESRFIYDEEFNIVPEKASARYPYGYFYPLEAEFEVNGVKYTSKETNENYIEVYKEGQEKPITVISNDVIDNAAFYDTLGYNFYYVLNKEVAEDSNDFTYQEEVEIQLNDAANSHVLVNQKVKQEFYKVELLTGAVTQIESEYVVRSFAYFLTAGEEGAEEHYGYAEVMKVRSDKTLEPMSYRSYIIDENFAFHDDLTYSPLFGSYLAPVGDHYVADGIIYDEMLNPIAKIGNIYYTRPDKNYPDLEVASVRGERIIAYDERTNMYGVLDKDGQLVVPFVIAQFVAQSDGCAIVNDGYGTRGLLDFAKGSITWFKSTDTATDATDNFFTVRHDVSETETPEYHYHTYFGGKYLGDFDFNVVSLVPAESDVFEGVYETTRALVGAAGESKYNIHNVYSYAIK